MAINLQQFIVILLILCIICTVWGRASNTKTAHASPALEEHSRQLFVFGSGKETSPPDFVRLVVMRLIYGLASTMGMEERLEGLFNGAFVPPNADDGLFNFGGFDYGGGDDGGLGALFGDY